MSYLYSLSQDWSNTAAKGDGLQVIKEQFSFPSYIVARSDAYARDYCQRWYEQGEGYAEDALDAMVESASKETLDKLANAYIALKQAELINAESVVLALTDEAENLLEDILYAESDGAMPVEEFLELLPDYEDGENEAVRNELITALDSFKY